MSEVAIPSIESDSNVPCHTNSYYKEVEASMIDESLHVFSLMCGDSVVLQGIRLYLLSRDKDIVSLGSFSSD